MESRAPQNLNTRQYRLLLVPAHVCESPTTSTAELNLAFGINSPGQIEGGQSTPKSKVRANHDVS